MPEGDPILAEMPAKQHEIAVFGVPRGKVDEPAVEILHLHAFRLEVGDEQPDLVRDLLDGILSLLQPGWIEASPVPRHLAPKPREPPSLGHEPPSCRDEAFDERRDDPEGIVRLLLAEEPHRC